MNLQHCFKTVQTYSQQLWDRLSPQLSRPLRMMPSENEKDSFQNANQELSKLDCNVLQPKTPHLWSSASKFSDKITNKIKSIFDLKTPVSFSASLSSLLLLVGFTTMDFLIPDVGAEASESHRSQEEDIEFLTPKQQMSLLSSLQRRMACQDSESLTMQNYHCLLTEQSYKTYVGKVSWYGPGFHGRKTASGERYNMYGYTAAHKTLPFGTILRLTDPKSQKTTFVTINDRGPYVKGRVLDLSQGAAKELGILNRGVAKLKIEVVSQNRE